MEQGFDKKTWFDFIIKLNDREIRKRSANGLTIWALAGVIGVLSFKIIDGFNVIFGNWDSLLMTMIFVAIVINVFVSVVLVFISLISKSSKRRFITDILGRAITILQWLIGLIFLLGIVFNCSVVLFKYKNQISQWPFYFPLFFYCINFLFLLAYERILRYFRREAKHIKFVPDVGVKVSQISNLLSGMLIIAMSIISIRGIIINNLVLPNQGLLKVALEFTTILVCLVLLIIKYMLSISYGWLEVFEKEIIINDLSVEQIRSRFVEEYMGKQAMEWLREVQNQIGDKHKQIQTMIEGLENNFLDFKDEILDSNEANEFLTLNCELLKKALKELEDCSNYIEFKAIEIKSFTFQCLLNEEEKSYIEQIQKQWEGFILLDKKLLEGIKQKVNIIERQNKELKDKTSYKKSR